MKTATITTVHADPRYIAAKGDRDRVAKQKATLVERIGSWQSEPHAFDQASLDQAAQKVLAGNEASPRGNLSAELASAKGQLAILDRAVALASRQLDEVAGKVSAEILPSIREANKQHNRRALQLDVERCLQHAEHQRFLAAHEANGVKGLPGIEWHPDLGALTDPNSRITTRIHEALRLNIITKTELQDVLEKGKNF